MPKNLKPCHWKKRDRSNQDNKRIYNGRQQKQLRKLLLSEQGNICFNCGVVFPDSKLHLDHIKPLEQGGEHNRDNVQLLCIGCHGRKTRSEQGRIN